MTNKLLRCTGCKDRFDRETMFKGPAGTFHSIKCAYDSKMAKEAKAETKANKAAVRDLNRDTLKWQHKKTQQAFNKMRVLEELIWFKERGLEPTCISCCKPIGGDQWCCGHLKTVGAHSEIRYDRENTKLQHNMRCNMNLSGDIHGTSKTHGYLKGLLIRFGKLEGQVIIDYCEENRPLKKWTCEELEGMRKTINSQIRELKKVLK